MIIAVIPFRNGHGTIERLLGSLPSAMLVVIVDDQSDEPYQSDRENVTVVRLDQRGYYSGAVNEGIKWASPNDVLVLNQDVWFQGEGWLDLLLAHRDRYASIGERIKGEHPAFGEHGYIHGVFHFMRRDALAEVGGFNESLFPLWGADAEWQLRAARKGYEILPLKKVPGLVHERRGKYGSSIAKLLETEPDKHDLMIRTPPLVSVIIPCYNQGRYLEDAINSLRGGLTSLGDVLGQSFHAWEAIIVNDASPDLTHEIAEALADPWQGIRYVRREANGGTPAANNTGIRASVGRYITMLSADDMMQPERLETLFRAIEANPHSVICDNTQTFANGKLGDVWKPAIPSVMKRRYGLARDTTYDFDALLYKNHMHAGIMFSRKAWAEAGGYDERMTKGREDWQFNIALGIKGYCGVRVEKPLYLYRREGQGRTTINTTREWHDRFLEQLYNIYPELYAGDRPMGCCGRGGSKQLKMAGPREARVSERLLKDMVGQEGLRILQYNGGNVGTTPYYGPVTQKRYTFANREDHRFKYVDERDAKEMLKIYEGRRAVFTEVVPKAKETNGHKQMSTENEKPEPTEDEKAEPPLPDQDQDLVAPAVGPVPVPTPDEEGETLVAPGGPPPEDTAEKPSISQGARLLAKNKGIKLSDVEPDGQNRITVYQVEAYLREHLQKGEDE